MRLDLIPGLDQAVEQQQDRRLAVQRSWRQRRQKGLAGTWAEMHASILGAAAGIRLNPYMPHELPDDDGEASTPVRRHTMDTPHLKQLFRSLADDQALLQTSFHGILWFPGAPKISIENRFQYETF